MTPTTPDTMKQLRDDVAIVLALEGWAHTQVQLWKLRKARGRLELFVAYGNPVPVLTNNHSDPQETRA